MATTGVDKIVERQMRNLELARNQRAEAGTAAPLRVFEYVAISRQKSSGGSALAHELGRRTGWQVFDREILNYMAHNDAVQQKIYEWADGHSESHFETFFQNLGFKTQPQGADYFRKLVGAVRTIAAASHAIFVGRGCNFVLPPDRGLRVRVVAPEDVRVQRDAHHHKCTPREAAGVVAEQDATRDRFIREHFGVHVVAPEHYDLVINTACVSTDAAVRIVVAGLEGKTGIQVPLHA